MADGIHRKTTIERFVFEQHPKRPGRALSLPIVFLGAAALIAGVLASRNLSFIGFTISFVMMSALASRTARRTTRPGLLDVHAAPGVVTARSQRTSGWYALGLIAVSAMCGLLWLAGSQTPVGASRFYVAAALLPLLGLAEGIRCLVSVARSVDLRFDTAGLTVSRPLRNDVVLAWDEMLFAHATVKRLELLPTGGEARGFSVGLQRTHPDVLRALIERCIASRAARDRVGDLLLSDLLVDAPLEDAAT